MTGIFRNLISMALLTFTIGFADSFLRPVRIENCVIHVVYGYALNSFFKTELRRIKDLTGGKDSFKTGLRETFFQELFHFFGLRTAGEC